MGKLLAEDNGNVSSMRAMCFVSLAASVVFGAASLYLSALHSGFDPATGIYMTTLFLVGAFAPKAVQKFAEEKLPK